jgi:hypothetical protein
VSDTLSLFDRVRKVEFWLLQHTETTISDDKRAEWPEAFDWCRVCKWGPRGMHRISRLNGLLRIALEHHQQISCDKGRMVLTRTLFIGSA